MQIEDKSPLEKREKQKDESMMKSWGRDYYQSALVQRNFFIFISIIGIIATVISVFAIRHIKDTRSIEPFVIEIEKKTGVPTVVDPLQVREYSGNEVVRRALVVQYIKAREEYFYQTYTRNYNDVIRAMSYSSVYYSQYRPQHSRNNPSSNYSTLGRFGTAEVHFKSIIFTSQDTAQVRLSIEYQSGNGRSVSDKIVLISFDFSNSSLSEGDRMINPLGFMVKLYRIENESVAKR